LTGALTALVLALLGAAGAAGAGVAVFASGLLGTTSVAVLGSTAVFALLACLGEALAERFVFGAAVMAFSALLGVGVVSPVSVMAMFCITVSLS
jgi:hypothetical protein